jgi:hypothetical protein
VTATHRTLAGSGGRAAPLELTTRARPVPPSSQPRVPPPPRLPADRAIPAPAAASLARGLSHPRAGRHLTRRAIPTCCRRARPTHCRHHLPLPCATTSQPRSSGPPMPRARTPLLTSRKDAHPRCRARPPPALPPQPTAPAGSSSGRGWWRVTILGPLPPVPAPLEVVADWTGEEADDGEVVADRAKSRWLGRGRAMECVERKSKKKRKKEKEKKIRKRNGKIRKKKKNYLIF